MDHLADDYGASTIQVELITTPEVKPPREKTAFHAFPETKGWTVMHDFKIEINPTTNTLQQLDYDVLLQAWLFFGLIFTVVQQNGRPILEFDHLRSGSWLNTNGLNKALRDWEEWEIANKEGLWFRMIQVEYVLDKARQVVRKNLGYDLLESNGLGYSTKKDDPRYLTDENALAIMTVGEALWSAKIKIMENAKLNPRGWQGDDDWGWGLPRYVFSEMAKKKWCKRAIFLLKGQLQSNAILVLQAYLVYKDSLRMVENHDKCTYDSCEAKTADEDGQYANLCLPTCEQASNGGCAMIGPETSKIYEILRETEQSSAKGVLDIPLLKFKSSDPDAPDVVELEVEPMSENEEQEYATISHVWSDGWGNEKANQLRTCQLQFIKRQLRRANDGKDILFWMDTLVVPVKDGEMTEEEKTLKKKAISQIFPVFQRSKYTIILDNGLCSMDPGEDNRPGQTAMKILASGWMRRLWTLQEAFLSRSIYITFRERGKKFNNLKELEALDRTLKAPQHYSRSPLTRSVRELLLQNIMGQERQTKDDFLYKSKRSGGSGMPPARAAILVANTWRAARWRTTSNSAHETLALATLLNLDYEQTKIQEAGLVKNASEEQINTLVCEFWRVFHMQYKGCIPPGIIFLPGEKVHLPDKPGYGWAPKTWLSAHAVDYPDPLSRWNAQTDLLENDGLMVTYPGFLLHTHNAASRRKILGTDDLNDTFTFPVDRSLIEWYNAKPADPGEKIPFLSGIANDETANLAIILSRPQPRDSRPEIGLLVDIYKTTVNRVLQPNNQVPPDMYNCHIIRRLHVWRETRKNFLSGPGRNGPPMQHEDNKDGHGNDAPHWKIIGGSLDEIDSTYCIGEIVAPEQTWVVDGYSPGRKKSQGPRKKMPSSASDLGLVSPVSSVSDGDEVSKVALTRLPLNQSPADNTSWNDGSRTSGWRFSSLFFQRRSGTSQDETQNNNHASGKRPKSVTFPPRLPEKDEAFSPPTLNRVKTLWPE